MEEHGLRLYSILGLSKFAPASEVKRAYRLKALQVHPDKRPDDPDAKEQFQQVQHAYNILNDPKQRAHYDELGDVTFNKTFGVDPGRTTITPEDIVDFEKRYKGSANEVADVCSFATAKKGDVSLLFSYVPCSLPEEVERYVGILQQLMKRGELGKTLHGAVQSSIPKLKKSAAAALARRSSKRSKNNQQKVGDSSAELEHAIQARHAGRYSSFLDELERRYSAPQQQHAGSERSARKRPASNLGTKGDSTAPGKTHKCSTTSS